MKELLSVDTIETAWEKIIAATQGWQLETELLEIRKAAGRILAQDISAPDNVPGFRRSTVDGYALHSADTAAAGDSIPVLLKLRGYVEMGKAAAFPVNRGECAYVPTGAMIPDSADAVVMIEFTENTDENTVAIYEPAAVGKNIAQAGEDMRIGEKALSKGSCLRPQEIGLLASLGIGQVTVFKKLKLALFSTGNELAAIDENLSPGRIHDINTPALAALAEQRGYSTIIQQIIPDEPALLEKALRGSLNSADVIVVSGGSSRGGKDYTEQVFLHITETSIFTRGLALKPGKPSIFGYDKASNTLLCGLPGHPVSAFIVFELFLSRLCRHFSFQPEPLPVPAHIDRNIAASPGKTNCQPVVLRPGNETLIAEPVFGKSGMISTLTRADAYVIIEQNKEGLKKGELVWAYRF